MSGTKSVDDVISCLRNDEAYMTVLRDGATGAYVYDGLRNILGTDKSSKLAYPKYASKARVVFEWGDPVRASHKLVTDGHQPLTMCHTHRAHPSANPPEDTVEHSMTHYTSAVYTMRSSKFRKLYNVFAREKSRKNVCTFMPHVIFFKNDEYKLVDSRIGHCALVSSHLDDPIHTRARINCVFDMAIRAQENPMHYIDTIVLSDLDTEDPQLYFDAVKELFGTYCYHFREIRIVSRNETLRDLFASK